MMSSRRVQRRGLKINDGRNAAAESATRRVRPVADGYRGRETTRLGALLRCLATTAEDRTPKVPRDRRPRPTEVSWAAAAGCSSARRSATLWRACCCWRSVCKSTGHRWPSRPALAAAGRRRRTGSLTKATAGQRPRAAASRTASCRRDRRRTFAHSGVARKSTAPRQRRKRRIHRLHYPWSEEIRRKNGRF